jgi:hypothetical protein
VKCLELDDLSTSRWSARVWAEASSCGTAGHGLTSFCGCGSHNKKPQGDGG